MIRFPQQTVSWDEPDMYLDPGSTSLFVQALFAVIATALTMFARSREWIVALWARVLRAIKPRRRPEP